MAKILGWLTITGLVLMVVAINARTMEVAYPLPIILLCVGAFIFLIAGIPWAHTRGMREMKALFIGVVGFAGGGAAGLFLSLAVALTGDSNLGLGIFLLIGAFWLGAILLGSFGVRWGIWFHRRYGPNGPPKNSPIL